RTAGRRTLIPLAGDPVSSHRTVEFGVLGTYLVSGGSLGFVGTAGKESVGQPAGLTVLADEFGDGAPVPMLPGSWGPDLVGVAGDGGLVSV
ncbi:hypothetical protein, partial [Mycobacterium tuberculosis]|uniref:PPW family C-terminal domain-containing PPE protein n=1 Tax=Mycobacterium tuberculosis TaxID=1773 RepID=UPI00045987AE